MKNKLGLPHMVVAELKDVGGNLRTARLRRNLSLKVVAERANISINTLRRAEAGDEGVSFGAVASILSALNLESTLSTIACPKGDIVGIEAEKRTGRKRASRGAKDELDTNF